MDAAASTDEGAARSGAMKPGANPTVTATEPASARANGSGGGEAPRARARTTREEDATWVESRTGAVVNTAFIAATLGVARKPPIDEARELLRVLADRPHLAAQPARKLLGSLAGIATGRSELEPWKRDRRYADPAWQTNRALRALGQAHAAASRALDDVLDEANLEADVDYRLRLGFANLAAALAPPNFPVVNPGSLKAALDTGGKSLVRGATRFVRDMQSPPRLPLRSDAQDFQLGVGLAATPGSVVLRTRAMEVIQYTSKTRRVHVEPVVIVPSIVNKFYLTDMSPGRSFVEHGVKSGRQMFSISWVNPDASHRDLGVDEYVASVHEAIEAAREISGSERVHVLGVCAGGQLASAAVAYLAATKRDETIASLTLLVCVVDTSHASLPQGLLTEESAKLALQPIDNKGYLDGRTLTLALAWLRPVDSVWWPWMQRYLLDAEMPKLDMFYWSEDVTNIPAAFVRDQLMMTMTNGFATPGALAVLGEPLDLGQVTCDTYVVAGRADHLTPWEACYRTAQLLGSDSRFVLVNGGHIQSIVRPPGDRIIPFRHAQGTDESSDAWLERAETANKTWWKDWVSWLDERSPEDRPMRRNLGNGTYPPLDPAPGLYVRRRLDQM